MYSGNILMSLSLIVECLQE